MKHITVFGSSRCFKGDQEYIFAESVGNMLGKLGYNVATGGYQGTMEAISKGACNHNVNVIGVTVPSLFSNMSNDNFEVRANEYINKEIKTDSLSNRIHYLLENSKAIIVLPGKIGTLTELIVAWNTNYLYNISKDKDVIPIFLKKDYWGKIIENMPGDMELSDNFFKYYENVEELEKFIEKLN
tara:strand:+ start:567 stop:1118 length:552 start_codon:yes stop_codon:yes gene_type:complete